MEYLVLNPEKSLMFQKDCLKIYDNYKVLKLKGDNYNKFVYPIKSNFNKISTREELFCALLKAYPVNHESFWEFNNVLNKLIKYNILIRVELKEAKKETKLIKKRVSIVSFIYHQYFAELFNSLKNIYEYEVDVIVLCENSVMNLLENENKNLKTCLITDYDEICTCLRDSDIIISLNFKIDAPVNLFLSNWSKKQKKSILFCTFYNYQIVIGPLQGETGYTCLKCVIKNDIVRKSKELPNIAYRKQINPYTWKQCCLVIESELKLFAVRSYSVLQAAVVIYDSKYYHCEVLPLMKFDTCSQCY